MSTWLLGISPDLHPGSAPGFSGSAVTVLYEEWKSLKKPGTPETRSDFQSGGHSQSNRGLSAT